MKEGTLFISPLGARNKKERVFKEIVSLCPDNDFSSVLYLAPNTYVASEAKRHFFSYQKNVRKSSAYVPFQALTIKQLAVNLHENITPPDLPLDKGRNAISARIRTLVLCEILKEKSIGYAQLLSELFQKIRQYIPDKNISQIKEDIKKLIFEEKTKERAVQAIEVLQAYEDFLKEKNLIDAEDMLRIISRKSEVGSQKSGNPLTSPIFPLDKGKDKEGFQVGVLVVDGFFDPTPVELEIITALIDRAGKSYIIAGEGTEFLKFFETHKEGITTKKLESAVRREDTGYYSYPSMEEEVEGIAKGIKKFIIDGVKPWEMTVCFPSPSRYIPMLKRIFRKHGIPVSLGEYDLSTTKPFMALEGVLACIEDDYPRNDFLSLITSPCFPSIPESVKERAVTYSYRAGTIKGRQSWLSVEAVLRNAPKEALTEDEKNKIAEFQKGIKQVIDILESIKNPPLPPFAKGGMGGFGLISFIDAFESALDKLGFFGYLDNSQVTPPGLPLDKGRSKDEISRAVENLFSELRQFAGLHETGLHKAGAYMRYLLQGISAADEDISGVKILPYEIAAGLESKALFFGGVLEENFPSRPGIDPILPEKVKRELGMPHLEYYFNRQKMYFKMLLNASALDPYFSCPSAEGDKIFLPSPFLDWEKSLCPVELNIFTEEDILVREGAAGVMPKLSWGAEMSFDKNTLEILRRRIGAMSKGYFRVTDIDFYRKCPLRFYIERVLSLELEEPPRFEVEYRLWGSLAHKTMEYLFEDKGFSLDTLEQRLYQSLEKSLKEFPIGDFWSNVAREIFKKLLPLLKEQETAIRAEGFIPYKIEENIKAEIDGTRLKGKIDRIDVRSQQSAVSSQQKKNIPPLAKGDEGGFSGAKVILLDYKTGSMDSDSLQMQLYARMWQENFKGAVERVGYYSLKDGSVTWYPKKDTMEKFMQDALQKTGELVDGMKKGSFPSEPGSGNECRYCDHAPLCEGAK
ncbi:MAG: PD-(D/E)XK nuclease family protein [Nitrospirae bacterium]|nr:PD-(D/E)XK nuclease family protein [Nitrospirota bacterium]